MEGPFVRHTIALARKELAHRVDDDAIDAGRVGCKGVDDHAVAPAALLVVQFRAAFDPLFRQGLARQRQPEEPSDPSILIDDEEKVSASDLIEEGLRPPSISSAIIPTAGRGRRVLQCAIHKRRVSSQSFNQSVDFP